MSLKSSTYSKIFKNLISYHIIVLVCCVVLLLEQGDFEFYVARSKMDQDGLGFVFHISEKMYKLWRSNR